MMQCPLALPLEKMHVNQGLVTLFIICSAIYFVVSQINLFMAILFYHLDDISRHGMLQAGHLHEGSTNKYGGE